jgi:hypothetical protein
MAVNARKYFQIRFHFVGTNVAMEKLLPVFVLMSISLSACSTQQNKTPGSTLTDSAQIETKTNISSSDAKANGSDDSVVLIRPKHKYRHVKKYKIK